jgi:F420-dependent oxidoreductase-like protein
VDAVQLCLMIEGQEGVSWPQWLDLAHACEQHGIGTLFRSDHYMNLDGHHPERGALDAWGTLCALAAATTALRLGTMVSPATFRHPSELAKLVVTADHVSGGRVELGLGAGWHEHEHAAYGFPFAPMRTRLDVLEEQLQVVLGSWTSGPDQPFSFDGEHYRLDQLDAEPGPVQTPHPPLIMGGSAGRRSSALAARYADEYNTPFAAVEEVRERRERIEQACSDAGREMLPFSVMTGVVLGADEADLRDRARRLEERSGFARLVDEPPSGWIVATVEAAAEQLSALAAAGVNRVMCQHLLHDDLDAVALIGERLGPAVA